ncbi:replication initiation protein [Cysteiniphilum sp. SYW-8]|uniref:replication initiation protein n=1 Tax=Cysteiniphilum sp. SYW-8 TaxID=2610890 RepID=UPI00123D11E9|nr:replication initiation protein [Cysteiniphilum sp. SYW-8]
MDNLKIVKDNTLIENFIFNATEFELHILNYAVAITNPYWKSESLVYKISVPELVKNYGSKNKDCYVRYRDALLRLQKRTYSYYIENEKYTENIITKVIENIKDDSYLEFAFNQYISNRIQNLKGLFTQYDIKNISMFRSRYAFMLYEFFKMKLEQVNGLYHQKILIDDIRENLDLRDKYKHFRDLRIKVLDISKVQINKHSDIRVNYEVIKTGRTPTHIKFTAQYKKGKEPQVNLNNQPEKGIQELKASQPHADEHLTKEKPVIDREMTKQRLKELKENLGMKSKVKQ